MSRFRPATEEEQRLGRLRTNQTDLAATRRNLDRYAKLGIYTSADVRDPRDKAWLDKAHARVTALTAAIAADQPSGRPDRGSETLKP